MLSDSHKLLAVYQHDDISVKRIQCVKAMINVKHPLLLVNVHHMVQALLQPSRLFLRAPSLCTYDFRFTIGANSKIAIPHAINSAVKYAFQP